MEYKDVFHLVTEEFPKEQIPCILVGGFVVNYYRYSRLTVDVDFLIDEADLEKAKKILLKAGYILYNEKDAFAQFKQNKNNLKDLDLILVDKHTFEKMREEGREATIKGRRFIVPSLFHLIAMKLHAVKSGGLRRELKDLLDIVSIIQENKVNVESEEFKSLCIKYGTSEIYEKIKTAIR